ncbi:hypothetical protein AVEN_43381-1 [Araneus ventricosus]|uniref:Uncharacterized protein n=1 Tax=Araneus ventricosus TaxID=182803 RepID=A0A4Y2RB78_ARAVE|nr:hypothetical protein AVEN_43381-1 [Araneus ventricosus]
MKECPPRQQSQALWFLQNSPDYEWLMHHAPALLGYDLSSEMGPNSHTTIIVPSGWRERAYLDGRILKPSFRTDGTTRGHAETSRDTFLPDYSIFANENS